MSATYQPELDISQIVNPTPPIGISPWLVTRLEIHMAAPRLGHVYCYLKLHHNARLVLYPSYLQIDAYKFTEA